MKEGEQNAMTLKDYTKQREYLICVDSDGCAMDTMNIKHIKCFGPCMVSEWHLEQWEKEILARWNDLNLYTITRGMNRFKGLLMALEEIHKKYVPIEGIQDLKNWVEQASELSNGSLKSAAMETGHIILEKALRWSETVNENIQLLDEKEKVPFTGVKEGLSYAHRFADIAIVSSANLQAVLEEWDVHELLQYTDIVLAQEAGSKAFCIGELLKKGYDADKVLMTGDAQGDLDAATSNGVFFYPILVRHEKESWKEFKCTAVEKLLSGSYGGTYQEEKKRSFRENLC